MHVPQLKLGVKSLLKENQFLLAELLKCSTSLFLYSFVTSVCNLLACTLPLLHRIVLDTLPYRCTDSYSYQVKLIHVCKYFNLILVVYTHPSKIDSRIQLLRGIIWLERYAHSYPYERFYNFSGWHWGRIINNEINNSYRRISNSTSCCLHTSTSQISLSSKNCDTALKFHRSHALWAEELPVVFTKNWEDQNEKKKP